jgi:nicotinamide riboside kinase
MMRISVTGPESTGKSWLAQHLAGHYKTLWVPEYARKYLESINRPYTYNDILVIAQKQFEEENSLAQNTDLLFVIPIFALQVSGATLNTENAING